MTTERALVKDHACKNPVRALHVFGTLDRGGAETWLLDVMRHSDRNTLGIDVCVLSDKAGAYEEGFCAMGGRVLRCPLGRDPWRFGRALRRLLVAEQFDVVHSHMYLFSGFVLRAAWRAGVPQRIAHIHPVIDVKTSGPLRSAYAGWMRQWIVKYGTHHVAPTKTGLQAFWGPDWKSGSPKSVIYNGVHAERFLRPLDTARVRRDFHLPDAARIVLNVSRFAPHKRQGFLVEVAEQLIERSDDVYFVLIGAGDLRDEVRATVSRKGLDERFRFVTGEPDIDRYWLSADAFAFPSINEGFGIVVAEAAAAGLPVVAQDIPGVREAAQSCHDVTLLPLDTGAEEWSRVLAAALLHGKLNDEKRNERLSEFPFTIEKSVAALEQLYGISASASGSTR